MPLAFILAGWMAKRLTPVWTMRTGIGLHALFYLLTLMGGPLIAESPIALGITMGLAAGFYWCAFNVLCLTVTEQGTREKFYGLNGVLGSVSGMVAPPVAGYFISYEDRFGGLSGYVLIFAISLALFVLATIVSAKLKVNSIRAPLELKHAFTKLNNRPWRMIMFGCTAYGLREGVFIFLIGLLLYISTGSEFKLGKFVLLQSALSFVSFYVVGKFVRSSNRIVILGIGSIAMAVAALFFLRSVTPSLIVWYGAVIAVVLPLFLVPLQGFIFDGVTAIDEEKRHQTEHIIVREIFENAGRVLGIVFFLVLVRYTTSSRVIAYFAVCLGFVQLLTWGCLAWGKSSAFVSGQVERREARPLRFTSESAGNRPKQKT